MHCVICVCISLLGLQQEFDQMKELGLPTMFINYYDDMEKVIMVVSLVMW